MFSPTSPRQVTLRPHLVGTRRVYRTPSHLATEVAELAQQVTQTVSPHLAPGLHSYRKSHSVHTAVAQINELRGNRLSFDIQNYFPSIEQFRLKRQLDKLDPFIWAAIKPYLGEAGIPTGLAFAPMLSNLYLTEIDFRFGWVRYCDNIMIVGEHPERTFLKAQRHLSDIGLSCHKIERGPYYFCKQALDLTLEVNR